MIFYIWWLQLLTTENENATQTRYTLGDEAVLRQLIS